MHWQRLSDHLWWITEAIAILVCFVAWLLVGDNQLLVYAITGVVLISLVFRLARRAMRQ